MADKRITDLDLHTSLQLSDTIAIVNSNETKKTTYGSLYYGIRGGLVSGSSQITIGDTNGFTEFSSSLSASIAAATNEQELSNYAIISGGNDFIGDQLITGSLFINGTTELGGDLIPKSPQGATLGTLEKPFKEIYVQSGSISIQSDTPGDPPAYISNYNGNLDIKAAGFSITSGSITPFQVDRQGQIKIANGFVDPSRYPIFTVIGNNEGSISLPTKVGTILQTSGFDGIQNRTLIDSYGTDVYSTVVLRNASGTATSPSNTSSGSMGRVGVRGWNDAQGFGEEEETPDAYIGFYSPYGFASGSRNAEIRFFTTPSGSNESRIVGVLNNSGLDITGSFTSSLQEGYMLVGDSNNRTEAIPTSSFVQTSQTGSFVVTASLDDHHITFEKGDSSTFDILLPGGEGSPSTNHYLVPELLVVSPGVTYNLSSAPYNSTAMIYVTWSGSNGTAIINLPDATTSTNRYRAIRFVMGGSFESTKKVDLQPTGGQTLDGSTDFYELKKAYEGIMVWSDGSNWIRVQTKA